MVREIIIPENTNITLKLPNEMVGRTVEVIAFEIDVANSNQTREQRLKQIDELTQNTLTDLSRFKFNRNQANNYDEYCKSAAVSVRDYKSGLTDEIRSGLSPGI